jgi:hypothetical protein
MRTREKLLIYVTQNSTIIDGKGAETYEGGSTKVALVLKIWEENRTISLL